METKIVLFAVGGENDSRALAEYIENMIFKGATDLENQKEIVEYLLENKDSQMNADEVEVWNLSDFMDIVNDEVFNPDDYFMSYIRVL